jgi:hypothetical protein
MRSTQTQSGTGFVWISSSPFPDVAIAIALASKSLFVVGPEVSYCEALSVGYVGSIGIGALLRMLNENWSPCWAENWKLEPFLGRNPA